MAIGGDYSSKGNFYAGADYGTDPNWGKEYSTGFAGGYGPAAGQIGVSQDLTFQNMLQGTSRMLNTGAKSIEVSAVNIQGGAPGSVIDKNPKQTYKEIERLKKLTGAELTFHGPLIEPTGVTRAGWNPTHREHAEKQMWSAVERAQQMEPDGNLVVTFHSSNVGLDDMKIKNEEGKEVIQEYAIVDTATGGFQSLPVKENFFVGEDLKQYDTIEKQKQKIVEDLKNENKQRWYGELYNLSYHASNGSRHLQAVLNEAGALDEESKKNLMKVYADYVKGKPIDDVISVFDEQQQKNIKTIIGGLVDGDYYLRDAYQRLQGKFNEAYELAKQQKRDDELARLNAFREEIKKTVQDVEKPENLVQFSQLIVDGVNLLRTVEPPNRIQPYRDFALEQSSETFSNIALNSYKKFKDNSPIISIENPPAGTAALDRAEDLRDLVKVSRDKLQQKLIKDQGLSERDAAKQAEKLIGVTWDVGHINMIRKFGYDEKDTIEQAKIIAPYVKHVHLSDNFGLEHTELPMGMGNVPIKKILELKQGFEKAKKIIEAGDWISRGGLNMSTPFGATLHAFGSPIYGMKMDQHWRGAYGSSGGYFLGYGQTLPEQHFSIYGAGFSGLPPELGGQTGRSRIGGTPME